MIVCTPHLDYPQQSWNFFFYLFLAAGGGIPLCPEILQYGIHSGLSSEFSTVRDAGFEPGTQGFGAGLF